MDGSDALFRRVCAELGRVAGPDETVVQVTVKTVTPADEILVTAFDGEGKPVRRILMDNLPLQPGELMEDHVTDLWPEDAES